MVSLCQRNVEAVNSGADKPTERNTEAVNEAVGRGATNKT